MKVGIYLTNQHPPGTDMVSALEEQLVMVRAALQSMRLISDELLPALRQMNVWAQKAG